MSVIEIRNFEDAKNRLARFFDIGNISAGDVDKLSHLLDFLSNPDQRAEFVLQLEAVSKSIWEIYNTEGVKKKSNRFTASIVKTGESLGFACQDNVVFVGALEGAAFGTNLRNGVLWKDSFALDHGEFSHSYQWLAAGRKFDWKTGTADLYKKLADIRSKVPLFVIDNGKLAFRRAPLWEYLVDCTNYAEQKCSEANRKEAVNEYLAAQVEKLKKGELVDSYFVAEYLSKVYKNEFFEENGKLKLEFNTAEKRAGKKAEIAEALMQAPDLKLSLRASFLALEVGKFAEQNAITADFSSAGTFRSPNNVTYLVRSKPAWFINSYQIHRSGRRRPFSDDDYPQPINANDAKIGRLGIRGREGVAALVNEFKVMNIQKLDADRNPVTKHPTTKNPSKKDMESGMVSHVEDRHHNMIKTPLPAATLALGHRTESFRSTNPIEGTRYAQHQNYMAKQGFNEVAPNVYSRSLDARTDASTKGQVTTTYHGVAGDMNASLTESIALSK